MQLPPVGFSHVGTENLCGSDPGIFIEGRVRTPEQCGIDAAFCLKNLGFFAWKISSALRDDFLTKRVDRSGSPRL